ncbi:MAG: AMP-binding protein, partial [Halobacteriovoraceae bacterium]|nr:AMP-binding protein [Halobacteriovoraceae bacterium]
MNDENFPLFIDVPAFFDETNSNFIWEQIQAKKSIILYNKEIHQTFIKKSQLKEFLSWPDSPFIGLFSSGSTGNFKLIFHHHESFERSAQSSTQIIREKHQKHFNEPVKTLHTALPLFHTGGLLNLFRKNLRSLDVHFSDKIQAHLLNEYSVAVGVPAQLPFLIKESNSPFSYYSGGDAPSPKLLEDCKNILLIPTYGLTESCGAILYQHQGQTRAFPNVQFEILKDQTLSFKSDRDAFAKMVFTDGWKLLDLANSKGFIETTDLAKNTERGIQILGRKDQVFISGGENIHPTEVLKEAERLLAFESFKYSKLKCLGMPDEKLGKVTTLFIETMDIDKDKDEFDKALHIFSKHFKGLHRPRFLCPYPKHTGIKPTLEDFKTS